MIIFDPIFIILPLITFLVTKNFLLTIIVFLFVLKFMYSPGRQYLHFRKDIFYSPSSGYISNITQHDKNITVSLFLNIFDNHTQYAPIKSRLISREYLGGGFVPAYREHAVNNKRVKTTLYNSDNNFTYTVTQITGILTRRIKTFNKEIYLPGDRLGFIVLGSRVDITVPAQNINKILIKPGEHIKELTPLFKMIK